MSYNERQVFMVTAAKRHGKSTTVRRLAESMPGDNILVFKEGVNLYDPAFEGYPITPIEQYTGGKAIIDGGETDYLDFLTLCHDHYRNGVLIIDDTSMYEDNILSKPLKKLLVNCRRLGMDVILVFHSLEDTPIKIYSYTDMLILGYCAGNFEYKLRKLPAKDEIIHATNQLRQIVKSCRCESQKPCKCGKRYTRRIVKLT